MNSAFELANAGDDGHNDSATLYKVNRLRGDGVRSGGFVARFPTPVLRLGVSLGNNRTVGLFEFLMQGTRFGHFRATRRQPFFVQFASLSSAHVGPLGVSGISNAPRVSLKLPTR